MTTPNAELAYKVLDLIQVNPEHFDMDSWSGGPGANRNPVGLDDLTKDLTSADGCGTTACFAGWTIAVSGYRVGVRAEVLCGDSDGEASLHIEGFAADLLGIDDEQMNELFYVENENIADAVAEIFGPRPEPTA